MKLIFLSNYMNHHQFYLCNEWNNNPNIDFTFIATESIPDFRKNIGYEEYDSDFVLNMGIGNKDNVRTLLNEADIVVVGGISDTLKRELIGTRLTNHKIVVYYEERFFKGEYRSLLKNFAKFILKRRFFKLFKNNENQYMFAASSKMKSDCAKLGYFENKIYAWGYFPRYEYQTHAKKNLNKLSIIWVGRYINWKHPEMMIMLAEELKNKKVDFHITMVGDGPLLNKIANMVLKKKLTQDITICHGLSNQEVLHKMQENDIFVSTSDSNEGWGVVINEAMSAKCLVIANEKIGAAEFLLKNNLTGLTYANFKEMVSLIFKVYNNEINRESLIYNATSHINMYWNYKYASYISYKLFQSFMDKTTDAKKTVTNDFVCPGDKV